MALDAFEPRALMARLGSDFKADRARVLTNKDDESSRVKVWRPSQGEHSAVKQ